MSGYYADIVFKENNNKQYLYGENEKFLAFHNSVWTFWHGILMLFLAPACCYTIVNQQTS